jgi:hypothetical protein
MAQRQNGDWTLRLTLQAIDMHPTITAAKMGTRYWVSLIELDDNEEPVNHKAMDRDKWRALGATKQAALRCKQPLFWVWLKEENHIDCHNEEMAADIVRAICGIESRADLDKVGNTQARIKWHDLDFAFQAWKAVEHA